MPDLEYKLNLENQDLSCGYGRFILHRDSESSLTLYAGAGSSSHYNVAKWNKLNPEDEKIYGGGMFSISDEVLKLGDYSTKYGSVPNEVALRFATLLKEYFEGIEKTVTKVKAEMEPIKADDDNVEKWRSLSFDV